MQNSLRSTLTALLAAGLLTAGCGNQVDNVSSGLSTSVPAASNTTTSAALAEIQDSDGTLVEAVPNQLLVGVTPGSDLTALQQAIAGLHGTISRQLSDLGVLQVDFPAGTDLAAAETALRAVPGVIWVDLDESVEPEPQAAASTSSFAGNYWVQAIDAPTAWALLNQATTQPPLTVVDVGFLGVASLIAPSRFPAGVQDSAGEPAPANKENHGALVAAFAAGNGFEANPVASGTSPTSSLLLYDSSRSATPGKGVWIDEATAIEKALQAGSRVINVSLGPNEEGKTEQQFYLELQKMREELSSCAALAARKEALILVAAGNEGFKNDNQLLPTNSKANPTPILSNMMFISANNQANQLAGFSNEGTVDTLSAPGQDISFGPGQAPTSGTSYATPLTAGAAAGLLNINPTLQAAEIRQILLDTATNNLNNRLTQLNYGAAARMAQALNAVTPQPTVTLSSGSSTQTFTVAVPASSVPQTVILRAVGDAAHTLVVQSAQVLVPPAGGPASFQVQFQVPAGTPSYTYTLWVESNNTVVGRIPVTVTGG